MDPFGRSTRPGSGSSRIPLAFLALLLACARPAAADIYRWVDEQGTIHFTDELSNVPPAARDAATLQLREAPDSGGSLSVVGSSPLPSAGAESPRSSPETSDSGSGRDSLDLRIEQLEAKIAAKERHIEAVESKQSLALNPLRNRFVEEADLELYQKYQEELPADREELRALEEELSSVR